MKASLRVFSFSFLAAICAATVVVQASAQNLTQGQQGAAQGVWAAPPTVGAVSTTPSACGNQPLCYDTPDFAVAVVDFRMSMSRGAKVKDATLRFVNKMNQPLILGYLDGSAMGLDDQGNRYATYYNTGLAGIGLVVGNSMDPKFTLQPGGAGDARFELYWRPGAQDPIGSTFQVGMTIREINTLVGGQHTLGGEFPLRFQGLANGITGAAPSAVAAQGVAGGAANPMLANAGAVGLPVCGPTGSASDAINAIAGTANSVGGQQTGNATTAASNAGNAISSLKSIFGKKKAAASAANTAGAAPCVPALASVTTPITAGASTVPAVVGQVVNATTAPAAATPAVAAPAAATPAAAQPAPNPATGATATGNTAQTNVAPAATGPQAMKRRRGVPVRTATPPAATSITSSPATAAGQTPPANAATTNAKQAPKPATTTPAKKPAKPAAPPDPNKPANQ